MNFKKRCKMISNRRNKIKIETRKLLECFDNMALFSTKMSKKIYEGGFEASLAEISRLGGGGISFLKDYSDEEFKAVIKAH